MKHFRRSPFVVHRMDHFFIQSQRRAERPHTSEITERESLNSEILIWFRAKDGFVIQASDTAALLLGLCSDGPDPALTIYDRIHHSNKEDFRSTISLCLRSMRDRIRSNVSDLEEIGPHVHFRNTQFCNTHNQDFTYAAAGSLAVVPKDSLSFGYTVVLAVLLMRPIPLGLVQKKCQGLTSSPRLYGTLLHDAFVDVFPAVPESSEEGHESCQGAPKYWSAVKRYFGSWLQCFRWCQKKEGADLLAKKDELQ